MLTSMVAWLNLGFCSRDAGLARENVFAVDVDVNGGAVGVGRLKIKSKKIKGSYENLFRLYSVFYPSGA